MLNGQDEISLLIRAIRQRTGLTQEKLAAKLGVTFPTVNRWEHGRTKPSPLAIMRIKELIGTLGSNGPDLLEKTESSFRLSEDERRLPRYRPEIIILEPWPVLEQGTD